jgi:hypothetical protein
MYIGIDTRQAPATAQLAEADDFGSFAVVVWGSRDSLIDVTAALADIGTVDADGEHAFLDPEHVAALATSTEADWRERFAKMIDFARSKGWTDDQGRVRAHLEWRAEAD